MEEQGWELIGTVAERMRLAEEDVLELDVEAKWGDDGFYVRFLGARPAGDVKEEEEKPRKHPQRKLPPKRMIDGETFVPIRYAAQRLRLTVGWIGFLMMAGRLQGRILDGKSWVTMSSIDRYLSERESGKEEEAPAEPDPTDGKPLGPEWVRAEAATAILAVSRTQLYWLAAHGKVKKRIEPDGTRFPKAWFEVASLYARLEEKEARDFRACTSPQQWSADLRRPYVRTKMEAPAGDRLISRRQAAVLLGVEPSRVGDLIRVGRLFAWQEHPGKRGSRVYLSERQVLRYADDPDRQRRRRLRLDGPAAKEEEVPDPVTERLEGHRRMWFESSAATRRDYGEYYTARQVGQLLGVTRGSVMRMRTSGRLTGVQYVHGRRPGSRRWWFFRKAEVHALMADPEYRKNRATYDRSMTPEAQQERAEERLARWLLWFKEMRRAQTLGMPASPASEIWYDLPRLDPVLQPRRTTTGNISEWREAMRVPGEAIALGGAGWGFRE